MGSPESETGRDSDERQHQVCVNDFTIGKYEVTQAQWTSVMGRNPSRFSDCADCPVERVSWNDVQAYLGTLNGRTGKRYRLPTEAEWEYAARAGTTTAFWTGRCIHTNLANYDGNYGYGDPDCGAQTGAYRRKTVAVGSFRPNAWGLYDTAGNVFEWTCSPYDASYGGAEQRCAGKDHAGSVALRGGSWGPGPAWMRSAQRDGWPTGRSSSGIGFRLAQNYETKSKASETAKTEAVLTVDEMAVRGRDQTLQREAEQYARLIGKKVRRFWVRPPGASADLSILVSLRLEPSGEVVPGSVRVVRGSELPSFDQSAIAAIYRASPLPVPTGPAFEKLREFNFRFTP